MGLARNSSLADWNVSFSKGNPLPFVPKTETQTFFYSFLPPACLLQQFDFSGTASCGLVFFQQQRCRHLCWGGDEGFSEKHEGYWVHSTKDQMWTTLSLRLLFPGHNRVNIQFRDKKKFLETCRTDLRSCRCNPNLDEVGNVLWVSKPRVENWSLVSASLHPQVLMARGNCLLKSPCPSTLPCSTCQSSSVHSLQHRWIPALCTALAGVKSRGRLI